MISLELAQKLKNSGLQWEPQNGDIYWHNNEPLVCCFECTAFSEEKIKVCVYMPRLDQLLSEIEKHGYDYKFRYKSKEKKYIFVLLLKEIFPCVRECVEYITDTPEDAAGQALLWVLEQEVTK